MRFAILISICCASLSGTYIYREFALRRQIIAKVTFRSLHERVVPRGGGLVFAFVFSVSVVAIWGFGGLPTWLMLCLGLGGVAAALIGFIDDIRDIRATRKLLAQVCLGA